MQNTLYYGDNLPVMREHIADESVDLVYLDPPWNSARDYNVLFKQARKDENQAQIMAFTDTWQWSKRRYDEFMDDQRNARLFDLIESLFRILGTSEMMAYLLMMAPRLVELHRVLKPTGSLYLHCDPTASHYLKLLMDVGFGPGCFRNEVVWRRTPFAGSSKARARQLPRSHDIILFYSRAAEWTWSPPTQPYSEKYLRRFKWQDERGYYRKTLLKTYSRQTLERLQADGRLIEPTTAGAKYSYKQYLHESSGTRQIDDVWTDINMINPVATERMGYPTQKPLALLERIVSASSSPGDLVLDPFCGCGTAVVAAEKLGRKWIGIDITYVAVDLIISRLARDFGLKRSKDYQVTGDPKDASSARKLFEESAKQFEIWAVGLVQGVPQPDKVADKGVDGKVYFQDLQGKLQWAVCQVKGGHLVPSIVRDFAHVIEREKAAMGFLICLETPSKGMYQAAEEAGFFAAPSGRKIPRLQIRTIKELLEERKEFDFPKGYSLKSGPSKRLPREAEQPSLALERKP